MYGEAANGEKIFADSWSVKGYIKNIWFRTVLYCFNIGRTESNFI